MLDPIRPAGGSLNQRVDPVRDVSVQLGAVLDELCGETSPAGARGWLVRTKCETTESK